MFGNAVGETDCQGIPVGTLIPELKRHKDINPEIKVFLNADKSVVYENVIEVLDSIRKSGIEKVSLETSDYHE